MMVWDLTFAYFLGQLEIRVIRLTYYLNLAVGQLA